jgi:hypothetical protein
MVARINSQFIIKAKESPCTNPINAELHLCEQKFNLSKKSQLGGTVFLAHLFCVSEHEVSPAKIPPSQVQSILTDFAEPVSLPPQRPCDNQIQLLPGSKPVNLRPYRFSHCQKLEIEKILEELLKNNFILTFN